jgi:hypothetical protein
MGLPYPEGGGMRLNPFLDRSIIPLCFRHMILSICEVNMVILDPFHHTAILSIAVYCSYHGSGSIKVPENLMERTIVLVMLFGIHLDQTSELVYPINCG